MDDNEARYLTIGEVSEATGLAAHTLRYYEDAGLMPPVFRDERGQRRYATTTVEWIDLLQRLRALGMTISEVRTFTALLRDEESRASDRLALLRAHRDKVHAQLMKLREALDILDMKLGAYSDDSVHATSHQ